MLTQSQVMDLLRPLKGELAERYRVRELALFGSLARQEQGPTSDVDLLVDFAEGATLFDIVGVGLFLEEKLGCPVDVVPRRALRREIRDEALNQAVPVLYLKDILAALDSIQAFTAGFDIAAFQEDDKTLSAVIRKFESISEATKGLHEVMREQYPEVP